MCNRLPQIVVPTYAQNPILTYGVSTLASMTCAFIPETHEWSAPGSVVSQVPLTRVPTVFKGKSGRLDYTTRIKRTANGAVLDTRIGLFGFTLNP